MIDSRIPITNSITSFLAVISTSMTFNFLFQNLLDNAACILFDETMRILNNLYKHFYSKFNNSI